MPRTPQWKTSAVKDGFRTIALSSWTQFHELVRQKPEFQNSSFVWRGQRDAKWALLSTFDRSTAHRRFGPSNESETEPGENLGYRAFLAEQHLDTFKLSLRGRRGAHPSRIDDENEWWAIGQHQGLATPLLDWTESPFVALYFAFRDARCPAVGRRSVWALNCMHVGYLSEKLEKDSTCNFVRPKQDENARVVAQAGLFTRAPLGTSVDDWVRSATAAYWKSRSRKPEVLVKITIPESERVECLETLNSMNINPLTLFPDVYGASQHCNSALEFGEHSDQRGFG